MNSVVHFEIQASDPERAVKFYTAVFDWEIKKWAGLDWDYWMVMTTSKSDSGASASSEGINGGIMRRPAAPPASGCGANAFVCSVLVEDFDQTAAKVLAAGGKVTTPKFALKGMAWQGYFLDPEGNIFGVHQPDLEAK